MNLIINKQITEIEGGLHKYSTMNPNQLAAMGKKDSEMFDNSVANPDEEENILDEV
jgi:hypothetical protein